jgi:hypothetical protein
VGYDLEGDNICEVSQLMQKGYIRRWEADAPPNNNRELFHFCALASDAAVWSSRESAETDCLDLKRGVMIPPGSGRLYKEFHVEEEGPDRFVIYCEAEF